MACILVFILHNSKAYSFDDCQIVVLHVQSKPNKGMAVLQPLHDSGRNSVIFISAFPAWQRRASYFCDRQSYSASAKCGGPRRRAHGKPLADVRFSC
jgi:hypothetical protein